MVFELGLPFAWDVFPDSYRANLQLLQRGNNIIECGLHNDNNHPKGAKIMPMITFQIKFELNRNGWAICQTKIPRKEAFLHFSSKLLTTEIRISLGTYTSEELLEGFGGYMKGNMIAGFFVLFQILGKMQHGQIRYMQIINFGYFVWGCVNHISVKLR